MIAFAVLLAAQIAVFPPLEEPAVPPEGPPPPHAPNLGVATVDPGARAPDARDLLIGCDDPVFTECFKKWRPPPPPPPPPVPEPPSASAPPTPPPPAADPAKSPEKPPADKPPEKPPAADKPPEKPEEPGFGKGSPPAPNPTADKATYDELVKAIHDMGLDGKVLLPEPPKGGNATMELNPGAAGGAAGRKKP